MHSATAAVLVGIGGFAGAAARWGLGSWVQSSLGEGVRFPYPTLAVNLLGCLAIGITYTLWETNPVLRLLVTVGFLGGFTTFSAFGLETLGLLRSGSVVGATLYVGLSATFGVILVWLGIQLAS